jgi:hypothetical protein
MPSATVIMSSEQHPFFSTALLFWQCNVDNHV